MDMVLDIFGYVGVGLVNTGLMILISYVLSRRPTQTMYVGENMIKRIRAASEPESPAAESAGEDDGDAKALISKKPGKPAAEENDGDWDMAFNIVKKRHGRGDWHMAFYFSILEIFILTALLMFIYTSYSLLKSIGLSVLVSLALYFLTLFVGRLVTKKKELTKALRLRIFMIYTLISCALSGTIITLLFIKWGFFNLL